MSECEGIRSNWIRELEESVRKLESAMDLAASAAATSGAQSIEWLFKKERMYLLAQFWQQVRRISDLCFTDYILCCLWCDSLSVKNWEFLRNSWRRIPEVYRKISEVSSIHEQHR